MQRPGAVLLPGGAAHAPFPLSIEDPSSKSNHDNGLKSPDSGASTEETASGVALALLPKRTRVIVTGNNRTKRALIGQEAVVKKAVGLGGWHFLVLGNGEEVKLQRNALSVLEYGPDDAQDSSSDEMTETREPQIEILTRPRIRRPPRALSPAPEITKPHHHHHHHHHSSSSHHHHHHQHHSSHYHHHSHSLQHQQHQQHQQHHQHQHHRAGLPSGAAALAAACVPLVDLRRLEPVSMRRYLRVYQLAAPSGAGASHEQLLPPIAEHFVTLPVEEGEVLSAFRAALRRRFRKATLLARQYPNHYAPPGEALQSGADAAGRGWAGSSF